MIPNFQEDRYQRFIDSRPVRPNIKTPGYELHHIKPRSLFPELIRESSNLILLTPREHYIAHWMLAKIYGGKMWQAFNQMRRVIPSSQKLSILYEYARTYISKQISISNTGRSHSVEFRNQKRDQMKGTVVVTLPNSKNVRISTQDSRYLSGELKFYRIGYKHTEETKIKMSESSHCKDRILVYNIHTGKKSYVSSIDEVGCEFEKGFTEMEKKRVVDRFTNKTFIHNKDTGEQRRWTIGETLPEGFTQGRIDGMQQGLSRMNAPGMIKVYDLILQKKVLIPKDSIESYQVMTPVNGYVVQVGNLVFENIDSFNQILPNQPPLTRRTIHAEFVIKSKFQERRDFCKKYQGLTYAILGIKIVPIVDFVYDKSNVVIKRGGNNELSINEYQRIIESKARTYQQNISLQ